MGTRALTIVYDERNEVIMNMYSQYDGYPEGHGAELARFLGRGRLVNGLTGRDIHVFNGMSCLAAQLVANFKDGAGGFYLYPVSVRNCGQDYEYHVYQDRVVVLNYKGKEMFRGNWPDFENFCSSEEIA
jgi:hypothetical protein